MGMPVLPEMTDIIAGIIGLACRGGEQLRIPQIYSTLCEMKGKRQILLAGLHFSITGSVCYSRAIEESLRSLVARGVLREKDRETLVVAGRAPGDAGTLFLGSIPARLHRRLLSVSRAFHRRMLPPG